MTQRRPPGCTWRHESLVTTFGGLRTAVCLSSRRLGAGGGTVEIAWPYIGIFETFLVFKAAQDLSCVRRALIRRRVLDHCIDNLLNDDLAAARVHNFLPRELEECVACLRRPIVRRARLISLVIQCPHLPCLFTPFRTKQVFVFVSSFFSFDDFSAPHAFASQMATKRDRRLR